VTDLRDQLADFDAAARRLLPANDPIRITHSSNLGLLLRELRHEAKFSQNALARRMHITKSGLAAREQRPGMSVAAFIDHARAVGYDVALVRHAGALTPDRRTA
jgi:DNA-binding XRE family transcriptional regulator